MTISHCTAFIGIGANLPSLNFSTPRDTCEAAIKELLSFGIVIEKQSSWYRSAPIPTSTQPWFINGIISVKTSMKATELMVLLQSVEKKFGRVRTQKNAARTLDLDLIDYDNTISCWEGCEASDLILPHPRMHERSFVLLPLFEISPSWCHPVFRTSIEKLIANLDSNQQTYLDNDSSL